MKTTTMTNDLRIQTTQTQASALRADLNMLLGNPHALGAWLPVVIKWTRYMGGRFYVEANYDLGDDDYECIINVYELDGKHYCQIIEDENGFPVQAILSK